LDLITSDVTRATFLKDYYIPLKGEGKIVDSKIALDIFIKEKSGTNEPPQEIYNIFLELIRQKDGTLRNFLDTGADKILLAIERLEDYRRALELFKVSRTFVGAYDIEGVIPPETGSDAL
jgi:hypothetical protein